MSLTQAKRECRCEKPNLVDHGIDFLDTLPPELLTNILGRLDYKAVLRCSSLSQKWSKIANCPHLWTHLALQLIGDAEIDLSKLESVHNCKKIFKVLLKTTHENKEKDYQGSNISPKEMKGIATRIIMIGDDGVGKTSFLLTYTSGTFPTSYLPDIFDNYLCRRSYNGIPMVVSLAEDAAGCAEYERVRPQNYKGTDVVLLAFSLVIPSSFESIQTKWFPEVHQYIPDAYIVLVGTQEDLRDYPSTRRDLKKKKLTPITDEQAEILRQTIGAKRYISCSSLTSYNVNKVMETAFAMMVSRVVESTLDDSKRRRCVLM
jgi:small GTP-binding protein